MQKQSAKNTRIPFRFDPRPIELLKIPNKALPTEHEEQRAFVEWFRKSGDVRIFAIPNGGFRGKAQAAKLKAEGVSPGVPDLYIPEWKLWIEMKRQKDGAVSKEQRDWIDYLTECGDTVMVCKGAVDAANAVIEFTRLHQLQKHNSVTGGWRV